MNDEIWNRPNRNELPADDNAPAQPQPAASSEAPRPSMASDDAIQQPPLFRIPPATPPQPRRATSRAGGLASMAAVVVLSAALGAGFITGIDALRGDGGSSAAPSSSSNAISASMSANSSSLSVADVYANVSPSVVEITTTARNGGGLGSGVVIRNDGLILTNYHVIEGATTIQVNFPDGQTATAKVVETKPADDLALIDVDGIANLQAVKLGNSDNLRAGDEIIAIGNPLGLDNTVTTGVVSALDRSLQGGRGEASLSGLIQIDAAVNSGNSGGGLFNAAGELVGVPSAIENPTGQAVFVGVAYAIPINQARADLTTLATL